MASKQQASLLRSLSDALAATVERVGASVVRVEARRRGHASGVVWSDGGLIVTADHCVQRNHDLRIGLPDGAVVPAELVGRDPSTDLALLSAPDVTLAPPDWSERAPRVGELALSVGRHDAHAQAALGIVAKRDAAWRAPAGGTIDAYLQTDIEVYRGFSGSALVDADGGVLGVNTSGLLRGVSLTVPVGTLRRVMDALQAHGEVRRGYLGISAYPARLPDEAAADLGRSTGMLLVAVEAEGPAAAGGLLVGDLVTALGETPVEDLDALLDGLAGDRIGQSVQVHLLRGGRPEVVTVTVGSR